ncbi:MAG: DUF5658 family protein [Candidatus Bathyarchaeia archaeon]
MLESLAILMNLANIIDLYTTKVGLSLGLKEANPFAVAIMQKYGFQGMATYKIIFPMLTSTIALTAESPYEKAAAAYTLALLGLTYSIASLNNVFAITLKLSRKT